MCVLVGALDLVLELGSALATRHPRRGSLPFRCSTSTGGEVLLASRPLVSKILARQCRTHN